MFAFLHSLRHSPNKKVIHIYTNNEACNMRAKLSRPDLQLIMNEIYKICKQHEIIPWLEQILGKQNIIPARLAKIVPRQRHFDANSSLFNTASSEFAMSMSGTNIEPFSASKSVRVLHICSKNWQKVYLQRPCGTNLVYLRLR